MGQAAQMPVYEAALQQYLNFSDESAMEAVLAGDGDSHLGIILLIIHKNNQNGLLKFLILKRTEIFENPETSGIVKFIILKKLFGDSDTLLKLFILKDIINKNNEVIN